jgi:hypothetical protein
MTNDELAMYIGNRILENADKLRLFMPDCYARFGLEMKGATYDIRIILQKPEQSYYDEELD